MELTKSHLLLRVGAPLRGAISTRPQRLRASATRFINSSLLILLILSNPFSSIAPAEDSTQITGIEHSRDRGYDYLDVYTTNPTEVKGLLLEHRLYIDFKNASVSGKLESLKRKSGRIASFAFVPHGEGIRLIVTLKKDIDYDIVNVFGHNKIVIEIGDRLEKIENYQFAWEKNAQKVGAPLKPVKLTPIITEKDISLKGKTIILDPGHGGDDPGAFSTTKLPEKIYTLQTAQAAAKLLREAGASVILTRNEDRRSNLPSIIEYANRTNADLFISIHFNSAYNSSVSGTETYYFNPISREFGEKMHEALVRGIKRRDHGLRRVRFYVVRHANMPSVLIEPAYLSNSDENDLIKSDSFQEAVAGSIVKGVKSYFRNK